MTTSFSDDPEPAIIQIASGGESGTKRRIACRFHGAQGQRIILETTEPIGVSSVISVEHDDVLFLGEVVSCRGASGPTWNLEVNVEQILTGLQSLMALRERLLGEGVPQHPFGRLPLGVLN